jgi:hypothetical protein
MACQAEKPQKTCEYSQPWSKEQAWEYYNNLPWLVGTNFISSNAINQLQFWQANSFDTALISKEISWSSQLGMNTHRVYLHNLLWKQDSTGFLNRIDQFLSICERHDIRVLFVLFDSVWHPVPKLGDQPEPIPHVHNSGWIQAPGAEILSDTNRYHELKGYVKGIIGNYSDDERIIGWDLFNEPDNRMNIPELTKHEIDNKEYFALKLLRKVHGWAREECPTQPLTMGVWHGNHNHWGNPDSLTSLDRFMVFHSDILSFHGYDSDTNSFKKKITELQKYGRPIMCTEYLARGHNNTFERMLPIMKRNDVAAYNWGLVDGKAQTKYPWSSWHKNFTEEPEKWHHDVLRKDGTPYNQKEVRFLKQITGYKPN